MKNIILFICVIVGCLCTSLKSFEKEIHTTSRDTIIKVDTVYKIKNIPGATEIKYKNRIVFDTVIVEKIKAGTWSTDTIEAHTDYAHAWSWIFNNKPFLKLTQDDINIIVESYIKRINILEQQLNQKEKIVEKRYNFYENPWFFVSIILGLLLFLIIYTRRK